ncbi:MAG: hypothetical protein M9887_10310 [Chitinophagales bacterium]|nr:hypothetical protein [Chitinophagales bacterium]
MEILVETIPTEISQEDNTHFLTVTGAEEHNLKNISVKIPRNQMTVITGLSGSGKSSLAFDTIFSEGQRRYLDSLSSYAKQFIGSIERPKVERISGLSPVISIDQKTTNRNPRSTVGTTTELYDFIRLLFARLGEAYSYNTGERMVRYTEEQIIDNLVQRYQNQSIAILAPLVRGRKGHYRELFQDLSKRGYLKVRIDGEITEIVPKLQVDRYKIHDIELVVDRIKVEDKDLQRIRSSVQTALDFGKDLIFIQNLKTEKIEVFSKSLICPTTGISYEEPSPNTFSFNSPYGYCPTCKGLGVEEKADVAKIISDREISIADGGIVAIGKYKKNNTFNYLQKLLAVEKDKLETPIEKLSEKSIKTILYGNGSDEKAPFKFEGIATQIERSYHDEISDTLKNWAANYISEYPCETCHGQRLRKESLHFKINGKNVADVTAMDLYEFYDWVLSLDTYFTGNDTIIARDILKELKERTHFLLEVGLGYLSLKRATGSLSGGESQRIRLATVRFSIKRYHLYFRRAEYRFASAR